MVASYSCRVAVWATRENPDGPVAITDAPVGRSDDTSRRTRRYLVSMLIRLLCFGLMYFVPGWWKLLCVLGAALIPSVAVIFGNADDRRTPSESEPVATEPVRHELTDHQIIPGEVVD